MFKQILPTLLLIAVFFAVSTNVYAADISIGTTSFDLDENPLSPNHSKTFDVTLSPVPTSEVTTSFSTNGECLLGSNNKGFTTGGSVFTKNKTLPFGLRTLDDSDYEGVHVCDISFTSISSTDPNYATAVVKNYSFTVADNDNNNPAGFNVVGLSTSRMQEGGSSIEQYEVQLLKPAKDDIWIVASADDQCDLLIGSGDDQARVRSSEQKISGGSLGAAQFTIIPREDTEFEGIHQCTIQHFISTDDPEYSGVPAAAYVTSIADNDINPDIPDEREYEGGLIYFKDANYDGVDDVDQPQVVSFINSMNGQRQALVITDDDGRLSDECSFTQEVISKQFNSEAESSQIVSSLGTIEAAMRCDGDASYKLLWLLDRYYPEAPEWTIYQEDTQESLARTQFEHIVYNLGDDFTSGLIIETTDSPLVKLLQDTSLNDELLARSDDTIDEFAASVAASNGNLALYGVVASAGLLMLYGIYRRFFRLYESTKTVAPDIDRF